MKKLLLHSCCAPCANQPIKALQERGVSLELYFGNSNIHYLAEWEQRRDSLLSFAASAHVPIHVSDYVPGDWFQAIRNDGGVFPTNDKAVKLNGLDAAEMLHLRQTRCRLCYRYRMQLLARKALEVGADTIATTLAISPYQFQDILLEELQAAADEQGLQYLFEDWRPLYSQGQTVARDANMYRQKYCGCEFSRQEAEIERAARRLLSAEHPARKTSSTAGSNNHPSSLDKPNQREK